MSPPEDNDELFNTDQGATERALLIRRLINLTTELELEQLEEIMSGLTLNELHQLAGDLGRGDKTRYQILLEGLEADDTVDADQTDGAK